MTIQTSQPKSPSARPAASSEVYGLPPLPMVLLRNDKQKQNEVPPAQTAIAARVVTSAGASAELDNETVVRRIIEHLLKEI